MRQAFFQAYLPKRVSPDQAQAAHLPGREASLPAAGFLCFLPFLRPPPQAGVTSLKQW